MHLIISSVVLNLIPFKYCRSIFDRIYTSLIVINAFFLLHKMWRVLSLCNPYASLCFSLFFCKTLSFITGLLQKYVVCCIKKEFIDPKKVTFSLLLWDKNELVYMHGVVSLKGVSFQKRFFATRSICVYFIFILFLWNSYTEILWCFKLKQIVTKHTTNSFISEWKKLLICKTQGLDTEMI